MLVRKRPLVAEKITEMSFRLADRAIAQQLSCLPLIQSLNSSRSCMEENCFVISLTCGIGFIAVHPLSSFQRLVPLLQALRTLFSLLFLDSPCSSQLEIFHE